MTCVMQPARGAFPESSGADHFSSSLDAALQGLEDTNPETDSIRDIGGGLLSRVNSESNSLASSHGEYDVPLEESAFNADEEMISVPKSFIYQIDLEEGKVKVVPHLIPSAYCYQSPLASPCRPLTQTSVIEEQRSNLRLAAEYGSRDDPMTHAFRSRDRKFRSKSTNGLNSRLKPSGTYTDYESDASSVRTQSTVKSAGKCRSSSSRGGGGAKPKRVTSNISNINRVCEEDADQQQSPTQPPVNWFSKEKRKRIKKMLRLFNNSNNEPDSGTPGRVVLAEL